MAKYDLPCDSEPASVEASSKNPEDWRTIKELLATRVEYKFKEDEYLDELLDYVTSTYGQHYSLSKIQSTEFIMDAGHGEGFTIGNIIKYAQRYGKKGGRNRADILKVCHYAIMMLFVHDHFNTQNKG
jgi:hypothetical protein